MNITDVRFDFLATFYILCAFLTLIYLLMHDVRDVSDLLDGVVLFVNDAIWAQMWPIYWLLWLFGVAR